MLGDFRDAILQVKDKEAFPMVLVANKIDLNREVSTAVIWFIYDEIKTRKH